eukprot:4252906-Amphidinium_carterae.1
MSHATDRVHHHYLLPPKEIPGQTSDYLSHTAPDAPHPLVTAIAIKPCGETLLAAMPGAGPCYTRNRNEYIIYTFRNNI